MGDERTYDYTLALRAVNTGDFMTATYSKIPHSVLNKISRRITNEVKGINRVVFDITDKPRHHRVGVVKSPLIITIRVLFVID